MTHYTLLFFFMLAPVAIGWLRILGPREERVITYSRFRSRSMGKSFKVEVWLPPGRSKGHCQDCQVLIANDGQDLRAMRLRQTLDSLVANRRIAPVVVVGIHAGARMQDYGVAHHPDYLRRGGLAAGYAYFVCREVLPFIEKEYQVKTGPANTAIMGFSLGGLSAFDIAVRNDRYFGRAGVFSGSFWWRSRGYSEGYTDGDRIMQAVVRQSRSKPAGRYWFEVGGLDETNDRDGDGIIDAISDTQALVKELELKGLRQPQDLVYYEMPDGRHNQVTWGQALPDFLTWAFPYVSN